jgi:hypothetical protein
MPKVEKKRSAADTYAASLTPPGKIATPAVSSRSPTPPPSPGAERRAQEEWRKRQAALMARIEVAHAEVLAGLQTLQQLKPTAVADDGCDRQASADAESLLAYDSLRHLGVDTVFNTVEQAGEFLDSSSESEESNAENEDA